MERVARGRSRKARLRSRGRIGTKITHRSEKRGHFLPQLVTSKYPKESAPRTCSRSIIHPHPSLLALVPSIKGKIFSPPYYRLRRLFLLERGGGTAIRKLFRREKADRSLITQTGVTSLFAPPRRDKIAKIKNTSMRFALPILSVEIKRKRSDDSRCTFNILTKKTLASLSSTGPLDRTKLRRNFFPYRSPTRAHVSLRKKHFSWERPVVCYDEILLRRLVSERQ